MGLATLVEGIVSEYEMVLIIISTCALVLQVIMQEPVAPFSFLRAKPIGVMRMLDQGEQDDKIIAVHADDPEFR